MFKIDAVGASLCICVHQEMVSHTLCNVGHIAQEMKKSVHPQV